MTFADIGGTRIAYETSGEGDEVVVLAGGSGMPLVVWQLCGLVDALKAAGYRVVTYAARGVAPSDAPSPPYSLADLAGEVTGLLDALNIASCHVVGYSLGGFTAELLARTRPDRVRSATLLASAGPVSPVLRATLEVAAALIENLGDVPAAFTRWEELMTSLSPATLRDDPEQVQLWWELGGAHEDAWSSGAGKLGQWAAEFAWFADEDRMAKLADISMPVLVACFEHDLLFPPVGGRTAAAAIRKGHFHEIPDAAHGGLMTHSAACIEPIRNFLEHT